MLYPLSYEGAKRSLPGDPTAPAYRGCHSTGRRTCTRSQEPTGEPSAVGGMWRPPPSPDRFSEVQRSHPLLPARRAKKVLP
jgi:hypothetical protein